MKLIIKKEQDQIITKIQSEAKIEEFSNLKIVDFLYKNKEDVEMEFDGLLPEEIEKIRLLYNEIRNIIWGDEK